MSFYPEFDYQYFPFEKTVIRIKMIKFVTSFFDK